MLKVIITLAIIFLMILFGITTFFFYALPIPWMKSSYIEHKTHNAHIDMSNGIFPDKDVYGDDYIGDVYVRVFTRGKDETTNSGHGPYKIYFAAFSKNYSSSHIFIHSLKIKSTIGKTYSNLLSEFPKKIEFEKIIGLNPVRNDDGSWSYIERESGESWANYTSPDMDFSFWKNEAIELDFDITLINADGSSIRKNIIFNLEPELKWGIFQFISV